MIKQKVSKIRKRDRTFAILGGIFIFAVVGIVALLIKRTNDITALQCTQAFVPVKLSEDGQAIYHVSGSLCARGGLAGKTVQLLMSGVSYDHNYWDFPYQPDTYSYVRSATAAGYATFNFDRLGVGDSDRPPAADVTVPTEAYVAHTIVQDLRQGKIGGVSFSKVVGVGHSMGASIFAVEGGTYNDTDGLILADSLHQANTTHQLKLAANRYSASEDPKFKDAGLPTGYLTTKPNTRGDGFYNASYADPNVIAKDEELKQTVTSGEVATLSAGRDTKYSLAIKTPVLLVVGEKDSINCNESIGLSCKDTQTVLSREKGNYSPTTCLEAYVLPQAGHDTNLHYNAQDWFTTASTWISKRVGASANTSPTDACKG